MKVICPKAKRCDSSMCAHRFIHEQDNGWGCKQSCCTRYGNAVMHRVQGCVEMSIVDESPFQIKIVEV